jgi:hypothetical protein
MIIVIPIPIGTKHIAAVQGAVWKVVSCAHCQQGYACMLELEATGEEHDLLFLDGEGSAERARAKAEENLLRKSRIAVVPVPCPNCGCYQDDMARKLKEEASINALQVAGAVVAVLSLVPLAFSAPYTWVLTLVLAVAGIGLVGYGYVVAFRFDPNGGDPELRKALGRGTPCGVNRWPNCSPRAPTPNQTLQQTAAAIMVSLRYRIGVSYESMNPAFPESRTNMTDVIA